MLICCITIFERQKKKKKESTQVKGNTHWLAKVICFIYVNHECDGGSQEKVVNGTKENPAYLDSQQKEGGPSPAEGGMRMTYPFIFLPHFSD